MAIHLETERLLMRDIIDSDVQAMYAMDSDPDVHIFLGNKPISTIEEAKKIIDNIQQQYHDNGIGRWAVIEKESGAFIGWSGFRLITDVVNGKTNYYDLGYRFLKKYWGRGYASETARASINHGFQKLCFDEIVGIADVNHSASNIILAKSGLIKRNEFTYEGMLHNFYSLTKTEWQNC
ncbi:GNAT family N-acetyltransferase [Aequorivita sediminis]|uniref:GNAT family N-acetyltransferase n=1 Tax=Aequorivita sediminis TaxID=3073653 RepID=UPI0028AA35DE|nr:GNAT family N-acetyltransferase [Aequorivita sp. F6058]